MFLMRRKSGAVHFDRLIELTFMRQGRAEIDFGLDLVGAKFDHLAISGDGGRVIPVLLGFDGVAENRIGIVLGRFGRRKQREK